ncbi:MAG: OmpH family outer membrane protein [Alphaproteobacteria bacterium]|nr:OmpH family outer membrane protein [Alphaproteobacteria bacterium]
MRAISALLLALPLLLAAPLAATAAEIAVVDTNVLWNDTAVGKDVQAQLKTFQQTVADDLKTREDGLQKKAEDLRKKKDELTITEAAFNQGVQELRQDGAQFDRYVQMNSQRVNVANQLARQQFYQAIEPILLKVTKDQKASVLLEAGQLLHFEPSLDITKKAVSAIDKSLKTLAVKLEPEKEGPSAPAQ